MPASIGERIEDLTSPTPTTDYTVWRFWLDVLVLAGVAANTIYTWWANREKITSQKFRAFEDRLTTAENSIKNPSCKYHVGFEERLDTINSGVSKIEGRLEGINRAVDLVNEFLINQGGRKS